jgi:hypothetical protein
LLAALGGFADEWPVNADELGELATSLHWWWWDANEPPLGWALRLVITDPDIDTSWAIAANDAA